MLVTKSNDLRLNTGIDPTSHWTSEQWTLLVRRLEYSWVSLNDRLPPGEIDFRRKLEVYLQIEIKEGDNGL